MKDQFTLLDDFEPVSYDAWREVVERDLNGAPFDKKLISHTYEGLDIKPVYTAGDWPGEGRAIADDPSGFAGFDPMTRGSRVLGNATCGWDIRQEHAHPDRKVSNDAILTDLQRGATSLTLRLDAASRAGLDADDANAAQLAGVDGLMVYTVDELDRLLDGVHAHICGIALEAGAAFVPGAAMLAGFWARRNVGPEQAWGAFNADPLAVLARDGKLPYSVEAGLSQMADLAAWTADHYPGVVPVRVGTAPYHHAGATATQDLAYAMATGVQYLRAMTDAGMDVNAAARSMLFNFAVGTNFFLAMAKLRAARKLWARVVDASGGDERGRRMRMHVKTSRRVVTTRDPWVNLLRNTACCFAGATADAEAITTFPLDVGLGQPSDFSRRIARNTQVILMEESALNRVIDPAGGSWFIESLTDEMAEKAWEIFQGLERAGGMSRALGDGVVAEQIDSAFQPRLKNIATRRDAVTGVSEYAMLDEKETETAEPDLESLREQAKRQLKSGREPVAVSGIGAAVEAAGGGASIGQLAGGLWADATPMEIPPIAPHPYAEPFEQLRDAADRFAERHGHRPRVFLANMGKLAEHTARTSFTTNFFQAGGFEVLGKRTFEADTDAAVDAFRQSGASIAVICSSDKRYPEVVPQLAPKLKEAGANAVVLAGHPGDRESTDREAGVDRFIYIKCDVLGTLRELLQQVGALD